MKIILESNDNYISITINDDGPGYPDDVIKLVGEPYIKSKSKKVNSKAGLGLGTFLGKTLLERQGARLNFSNNQDFGASVKIMWETKSLISTS